METLEKRGVGRPKTEKTDIEQKEQPKKGTKPGWKPSSVLPQLKARTGFTARWVKNESGNVAKKMAEGWILMKPSDNVGVQIRQDSTPDANSLAGEIRYRDMVAMMLPNDVKAEREEYMRQQNVEARKQILDHTDADFKKFGVQSYAPKGHSGRIVIE